jgi:hypothetical protein
MALTWDSFLLPIMDSRSWLTIWLVPHGVASEAANSRLECVRLKTAC